MSVKTGILREGTRTIVVKCLQIVIALQAIGLSWSHLMHNSDVGVLLSPGLELPGLAWGIELAAGVVLGLVALVLLRRPAVWALIVVAAWEIISVTAAMLTHSGINSIIQPVENAVTFLGPIALIYLSQNSQATPEIDYRSEWILRIAAACTFIGHGLLALLAVAHFQGLIQSAAQFFLQTSLPSASVAWALRVIGVVDVLVAGALLLRRWPGIAAYMAFWGFTTALSRTIHFGLDGAFETLVRVPNGGIALTLFLWWFYRNRRS